MESRYAGDPINEPMYESPEVEETPPELAGMDPGGPPPELEEGDIPILPSLDATWSVLDTEPGMDDMMKKGGKETL